MRQLRKQVDMLGGGIRHPVSLHVFAGENNLLETWNIRLTPHDQKHAMRNPTYSMSKTLLELSIFLRSLQSLVGILPATIRSNRRQGESYNITLSKPGKKSFREDAMVVKYQFKSLHSILGVFEVEVLYRKNVMNEENPIHAMDEVSNLSLSNNMDGGGNRNDLTKAVVNNNYIPGPTTLTRVKSDPRQIPTNISRSSPNSSLSNNNRDILGNMRDIRDFDKNNSPVYPSSYAEGTGRQRRFGSFGDGVTAAFSVGTPPLHPSSLGSNYGNRSNITLMAMSNNARGSYNNNSGNNSLSNSSNLTQFSPCSVTPPAFAPGSFKSSMPSSPFNIPPNITGSSPPFAGIYMANRNNSKRGGSRDNGVDSITPIGIKNIKPTPSPPTYSYFTSPYASFMTSDHNAKNAKDGGNVSANNNANSGSTESGSTTNIGDMSLHSPWGNSLGVVAKRAGKECQYAGIDTTWIRDEDDAIRAIVELEDIATSSLFFKVDKKKKKKKKKKKNSAGEKAEDDPRSTVTTEDDRNNNGDTNDDEEKDGDMHSSNGSNTSATNENEVVDNNNNDNASENKVKKEEVPQQSDIDEDEDAAFGWYDECDAATLFSTIDDKYTPTSLDVLNTILKNPGKILNKNLKPIKLVMENATAIVEEAKGRLQHQQKETTTS
jgi:hypothetical protein